MPTESKSVADQVTSAKPKISDQLKEWMNTFADVIETGDVVAVNRLRNQIITLRAIVMDGDDYWTGCTKTFDMALLASQFGLKGVDFLKGVKPVINRERGKTATVKPERNPDDYV